MSPAQLLCQFIVGVGGGMILFLMAAGVSIIVSGMNIINFVQGAFFMLGALMCYSLSQVLNFWWALLFGPLAVACIGLVAELLLRPLYKKTMLYQLLITMGLAFLIIDGMDAIWGREIKVVALPDYLNTTTPILGLDFPMYYVFIIAASGVMAAGLWLMFEKTRLGMIFRAIISNRSMVDCLGINVKLLFSIMFAFGVWLSGIAGVLMAPIIGIDPEGSMDVLFAMMTVLVIGGLKSMKGALFAALLVGVINAFGSLFLPWFYALIPAALMIIVLLIKPQGLFGEKEG
jgi:branched-subunit amino acid ABC-type transport system permease component